MIICCFDLASNRLWSAISMRVIFIKLHVRAVAHALDIKSWRFMEGI